MENNENMMVNEEMETETVNAVNENAIPEEGIGPGGLVLLGIGAGLGLAGVFVGMAIKKGAKKLAGKIHEIRDNRKNRKLNHASADEEPAPEPNETEDEEEESEEEDKE